MLWPLRRVPCLESLHSVSCHSVFFFPPPPPPPFFFFGCYRGGLGLCLIFIFIFSFQYFFLASPSLTVAVWFKILKLPDSQSSIFRLSVKDGCPDDPSSIMCKIFSIELNPSSLQLKHHYPAGIIYPEESEAESGESDGVVDYQEQTYQTSNLNRNQWYWGIFSVETGAEYTVRVGLFHVISDSFLIDVSNSWPQSSSNEGEESEDSTPSIGTSDIEIISNGFMGDFRGFSGSMRSTVAPAGNKN